VEDNPEVLTHVKVVLESEGFKVITSKSGNEALKRLNSENIPPDLVISDIKMPGMDGYELFTKILNHESWKKIPFIFLTALDSDKQILEGKSLGVDDYLIKPFKEKDLLAVVKGKLKRINLQRKQSPPIKELNLNLEDIQLSMENTPQINFFLMKWSESYGARLQFSFPETNNKDSMQDIGQRLMQTAMNLRFKNVDKEIIPIRGGLSIDLKTLNKKAYIYLDTIQEDQIYMIGVIAPKLKYVNIVELKDLFQELFLKMNQDVDMKINYGDYWRRINFILKSVEK